jgi:DnaJ-class molecular chaperone
MEGELCRLCGGDGRIGNALGRSTATCPSCHGSGRRAEQSSGFHDVTKTKPSHYRSAVAVSAGPKGPQTAEGTQLALEVSASTVLAEDAKTRLLAEIINHESTHGRCTRTFIKKIRKQTKPVPEKK